MQCFLINELVSVFSLDYILNRLLNNYQLSMSDDVSIIRRQIDSPFKVICVSLYGGLAFGGLA